MNYQNWLVKSLGGLRRRISNHFVVYADIANFFPSIYTHSIAWALVGIQTAKGSDKKQWFDEIDRVFQAAKRKETNGIAIGPATSNIVAEVILKKVDDALIGKGFNFYRYIDDFTCFTKTKSEAERFVNELRTELNKYKLVLNAKKTKIWSLPRHDHDDWLYQIKQASKLLPRRPKPSQVVDFIESLVEIENRCNDKSVFKYGFAILGDKRLSTYSRQAALVGCMSLCFQVPNLHSMLRYFQISKTAFAELELKCGLIELLSEAATNRQSDSMCWYLYYCNMYEVEITDEIAASIVKTRDCLSLLLLYCYASPTAQKQVVKFANRAIGAKDAHDRHQYWLLTFELYRRGIIQKVGNDKQQFDMMVSEHVHFCTA